ncbi:MAG: ATP-dependent Clp protease proteolytic subunit, partial [Acidobacteriota bacterium]
MTETSPIDTSTTLSAHSSTVRRRLLVAALLCGFAAIGAWLAMPAAVRGDVRGAAPVLRVELDSPIHPMASRFVDKVLGEAAERGAAAVVIELNTPGGSLPATRRLCQAFLASEVPVIVYVSPGGAQAASAGFFLLMAADVAAMAPGTNTGSAHPVTGSGEDIQGAMGEKVLEDALALVRSLAEQRGRDLEVVQAAVSESRSMTATEAFDAGIVDAVAA